MEGSSSSSWRRSPMQKLLLIAALLVVWELSAPLASAQLTVGFYKTTCPSAEKIIQKAVATAFKKKPVATAAGLLRLHFHDCFVHGCDASVLVDSVPGKDPAEKDGFGNANSLRGFEVVDAAKAQLEATCPGTVSCADVLAYAARDSVVLAGGLSWAVEGGRRDGARSSAADLRGNLPPPTFDVAQLTDLFFAKGLTQDEMVTLSGSHSIGQAHCGVIAPRLNASAAATGLDARLAAQLRTQCAAGAGTLVNMEPTPKRFDSRYYSEGLKNRGLFPSDHALVVDAVTRAAVLRNANSQTTFLKKFGKAMVKMGRIQVLTGAQGEVRLNCRAFN